MAPSALIALLRSAKAAAKTTNDGDDDGDVEEDDDDGDGDDDDDNDDDDDDDDDDDNDDNDSTPEIVRKVVKKAAEDTTATTLALEGMSVLNEEMDTVEEDKLLLRLLGGSSVALLKEDGGFVEYMGSDLKGRQMVAQMNKEFREERKVKQRNEAKRYRGIIPSSLRVQFSDLLTEWRQNHGENEQEIRDAMGAIARRCSDRWDAVLALVSSVLLPFCTLKDLENLSLTRKGLFFGSNTFQTLNQCMLQEIHRTKPVKGSIWWETGGVSPGKRRT